MYRSIAGIAQFVERPTKSQAQYGRWFESLVRQRIFLPEPAFSADSYSVRTFFTQSQLSVQTLTVSVHFSPRASFQCRLLQCPYIFLPEPAFSADSYSVRTFFSQSQLSVQTDSYSVRTFFSQSQLSVQTLTVSVHFSPRASFQCRQTLTVSVHFSPRASFQCRLLQCPYIFHPEPAFSADSYSVRTFFSQSQLSVQTLTVSVHFSPRASFQCRQTLTVSVHFSPRASFQCRLLQCPYIFLPEPAFSADSYSVRTFFSQSQLSVQTLTVSVQPPCAIACIDNSSTIARTLKIQNIGSHNVLWTQENTAHIDRNGIALLLRRLRFDVSTCSL